MTVYLADIVCFQETKLARQEATEDLALAEGWCGPSCSSLQNHHIHVLEVHLKHIWALMQGLSLISLSACKHPVPVRWDALSKMGVLS